MAGLMHNARTFAPWRAGEGSKKAKVYTWNVAKRCFLVAILSEKRQKASVGITGIYKIQANYCKTENKLSSAQIPGTWGSIVVYPLFSDL